MANDDETVDELDALLEDTEDLDPFDDSATDEAELEDSDDDGAGADEAKEDDAGTKQKTVPYSRFQKLVAQRNAERDRAKQLETENELHAEFMETLGARYKRFKKPAAQLAVDADFMESLEQLATTNADAKALYQKVTSLMENPSQTETKADPKVAQKDPRLDEVLRWKAEQVVTTTLEPLKLEPRFTKLIQQHVLANAKDPGALTVADVRTLTKEFMTSTGFTLDQMKPAAKAAPAEKGSPKTTHQKSVATRTKIKSAEDNAPKFENREQLLKHRESVLSDLITELESSA